MTDTSVTSPSRRRIATSAAWALPAVALTSAAPAVSASTPATPAYTTHWGSYVTFTTQGRNSNGSCGPNSYTYFSMDNSPSNGMNYHGFWIEQLTGPTRVYQVTGLTYTLDLPTPGLSWTVDSGNWVYSGSARLADGYTRYTFTYTGSTSFMSGRAEGAATDPYFTASSNAVYWCDSDNYFVGRGLYSGQIDGTPHTKGSSFDVNGQ